MTEIIIERKCRAILSDDAKDYPCVMGIGDFGADTILTAHLESIYCGWCTFRKQR